MISAAAVCTILNTFFTPWRSNRSAHSARELLVPCSHPISISSPQTIRMIGVVTD